MIDSTAIQLRRTVRDDLDEATERFLAAGGQIQKAPAMDWFTKPLPIRPAPVIRTTKERVASKAQLAEEKRKAFAAQLREMAKTMTVYEAATATGKGVSGLTQVAYLNGFFFQKTERVDRTKDANDVPRILAMLGLRIGRTTAARRLCMHVDKFDRICTEYNIDFPKLRVHGK